MPKMPMNCLAFCLLSVLFLFLPKIHCLDWQSLDLLEWPPAQFSHFKGTSPIHLGLEDAMRVLGRWKGTNGHAEWHPNAEMQQRKRRTLKTAATTISRRRHVLVLDAHSNNATTNGGRCIISADQAVHFCGFAEEVNEPPILPHLNGVCRRSEISDRTICYPRYEELDTSCTDAAATNERSGLVAPPVIAHANVKTMAFVPPDNLHRLIRQYYRLHGKPYPKNETEKFSARSFLFVKYGCEPGYELMDEADTMFCRDRVWVQTPPICRGKGLCERENGGCSHSCISFEQNRTVECRCPKGLVLDSDDKTCVKPVPKSLCRKLSGCTCTPVDDRQLSCACPGGDKCLLVHGRPKIYLEPSPDYQVEPGGNLNITCSAVAYPFPEIVWQREEEAINWPGQAAPGASIRSEQLLIIKEIYKSTNFTCHARNELGDAHRLVRVEVTGPGSAPVLRELNAGRSSIQVQWERPHVINRPLTVYSLHFSTDPSLPIRNWDQVNVSAPAEFHTIPGLQPDTLYTIRIRAHDPLGPGKLSNPVSVRTLAPAKRPFVLIPEGPEIRVPPKVPFGINCNLSRGDPIPGMHWESRGRNISASQQSRHIALQHSGLYESVEFQCVAENEAGRSIQKVFVLVTGPSQPERIRYHVEGNTIVVQWEEPRITNGPMADYEVFYTEGEDVEDKPDEQWMVQRSGGPDKMGPLTLAALREQTDYTVKIRGLNRNGPGLFSLPFTVRTWLAPRAPVVSTIPEGRLERRPSQDELEVNCEADGVPRPKILWWWEGRPVEDGQGGFRVVDGTPLDEQVKSHQKLIFQSSTRSGTLKCQAINERGVAETSIQVQILGPGTPPDQISVHPVQDGFSIHWLPPQIPNGDVIGYAVYWSRDPDAELADWSQQTFGADVRDATIAGQEEQTPYVVRLQAIGRSGPGIISPSYEVVTGLKHIPLAVKIRILEPQIDEAEEGGTLVHPSQIIKFQCIADGRPQPIVSWSWVPFGNASAGPVHLAMEADPQGQPHRFVSAPTTAETSTNRTLLCEARNEQGQMQNGHQFRVLKPGGPPEQLGSLVDLDNRVTLDWGPPIHENVPLTGYTVYISPDPSLPLSEWKIYNVPSDQTSIVFPRGQLEPDTPYYVRVEAENVHGKGKLSDIATFVTKSGAPLDPPTDVLVQVGPDNSITAGWSPPSQPNGELRHYTVYFVPEDQAEDDQYRHWPHVQVPIKEDGSGQIFLDREVHGILPQKAYRFRVTASNELSEGPPSPVAIFRTGTGEVAPTLVIRPADNPANVKPMGDYSVICEGSGLPAPEVWWTLGMEGQRETGGTQLRLNKMTKDVVAVCHGKNNAGEVELVLNVQVSGPGTPPNEIVAMPLPEQALAVEWTAPDEPNGKLAGYIVHYAPVEDGQLEPKEDAWKQIEVGQNVNKHQLEALRPKTIYWVRVQALSDRGPGVISDPVKARTLPLAPQAPDVLPIQVHPNNTVIVQFVPSDDPEQEGKKVTSYKIQYTKEDPGLEDAQWNEIVWNVPPGVDPTQQVQVFIDGMQFDPQTKYHVKVIPIGEIEGPPSPPKDFDTQTGIVAPDQPLVHLDTEDNVLRVPAGTDYTVECTANGFPPPKVFWTDSDGNVVSDGGMLRVFDIRQSRDFLCIADNVGGRMETKFGIFVVGPGSAPENVRLSATKPKSILVKWDPPAIPNGNITRYVIYYTPLDDQSKDLLVGQVPQKPISEWMSTHLVGEGVGLPGQKQALLTDFVEADTAYAVVVQAANEDGPGPYSIQHNIRTMSRARAAPPTNLLVEPINQTSVEVRWRPAVERGEEDPIGYEIYFVPAEKRIEEDEQLSLPKWTKVDVADPSRNSHMIWNQLEPDTEYVFKIRALYPSGPGVFSEPCIAKTLPEGDAPFLVVSAGGRGTEGESVVRLLPGSDYTVFCRASGKPQPAVRWIRGGDIPIDPSTVKEDETGTKWSLSLVNISEPSTFKCVARNPLGVANWSIHLELVEGLRRDWIGQLARPEMRQGQLWLHFADTLPDSLRRPNQWTLRYSDDPNKERILWSVLESEDRPLTSIPIKSPADPMLPGLTYHLLIENLNEGVRSPVLTVLIPKAPSELRVGSNINDEMVVDFRPAIASVPVEHYLVKYWPAGKEGEELAPGTIRSISVPGNRSIGIRVPDLPRDAEFYFQAVAQLGDGQELASPPVLIRTPAKEIRCDCSHACRLLETDSVEVKIECYCPEGWELAEDGRTCAQPEPTTGPAVEISPTFELDQHRPELNGEQFTRGDSETGMVATSPLPTDEYGNVVTADLEQFTPRVLPTDSLGREIRPVVYFNGSQLRTDADMNYYDPLGRKVERDEEQRALGPDGKPLKMNARGNYVYPPLDRYGEPMPTDSNLRPIFEIVDEEGGHWPKDGKGRSLDHQGKPVPTNAYGQPLGPGSSPLPTNFYGQFVLGRQEPEVLPTDSMGYPIYPVVGPDGQLLPTASSGQHLDPEKGEELPRDSQGIPLDSRGRPLPQNRRGQYVLQPVLSEKGPDPGLELRQREGPEVQTEGVLEEVTRPAPVIVVGPDGLPLPTDRRGLALDARGKPFPTSPEGILIGPDGSALPTDSQGRIVVDASLSEEEEEMAAKTLPTDQTGREIFPVVDQFGELLPTDLSSGQPIDQNQIPIPTDSSGRPLDERGRPLPKNEFGQFIYNRPDTTLVPLPGAKSVEVNVVDAEGRSLEKDDLGNILDSKGHPLPTNPEGLLLGPDGSPLPTNAEGQFVLAYGEERDQHQQERIPSTDSSGKVLYPIVKPDGGSLERDPGTGNYLDESGETIKLDDFGRPLNVHGQILPTNIYGEFVWVDDATSTPPTHQIGPDGLPIQTSKKVPPAYPDSKDLPTLEDQAQCRIGDGVIDLLIAINHELLQSSGENLRKSIANLLSRFDLSADATRVGLVHFGKSVNIPVSLGGYHDREELLDRLGQMRSDSALGIPDISSSYRAAVQQFSSFGRDKNVPRVLILLSSGEDIFPDSSAKQSLGPLGIFLLLVGPSSYDAEIGEESGEHIIVDKWELLTAERMADYLEAACQRNVLRLPKSRAKYVTGKPTTGVQQPTNGLPIQASSRRPIPTSSSQCAELQQRSRVLLAVETSEATSDVRWELSQSILHFIREYVERSGAQVGILYYGDTVEVGLDVGHYNDQQELEESVQEMHFVGGQADPVLAIRTAQQLLMESGDNVIKLVLHIHRNRLPAEVQSELNQIVHSENIGLIDLFYERWGVLENLEPYWSRQLCMLEAMIDRLENTIPANIDEIFFGPPPKTRIPPKIVEQILTTTTTTRMPPPQIPTEAPRILPTDQPVKAAHPVLGPDGQLMPMDSAGNYLDFQGNPLTLDELGRPLDSEGRLLPQDSRGFFLLHTTGPDQSPATRQPHLTLGGSPLPTDESGEVLREHEVGRGEMALPTDQTGKFIHPVLNARTGEPLATDTLGRYLDVNGELLPTDDFGRPVDPQNGQLLPTNRLGQFLYTPSDDRQIHPATIQIVTSKGVPMPKNAKGFYTDFGGRQIPLDEEGRPFGRDGTILAQNANGQFVWPDDGTIVTEIGPDGLPVPSQIGDVSHEAKPLPRDEFVGTIPVVDHQGNLLPTDPSGQFLDAGGDPLHFDHLGRPLDPEGRPLPTDRHGQFVYTPPGPVFPRTTPSTRHFPSPLPTNLNGHPVELDEEGEGEMLRTLPTDGTGKQIFPVISAQTGSPLAKNYEGRYVNAKGELIAVDDFGRPLDGQGRMLPTNEFGQFIYSEEPDINLLPTMNYDEGGIMQIEDGGGRGELAQRRRNETRHCFVSGFIELLIIFDTSSNIKILDYRMMKEAVKGFLLDHFDLRPNRGVRLGLLKYGDNVEVPIALGDYDSESELLARLGETRRLKGEPNLQLALQEAAGEFQLSGADEAPRVVLVWKSGNSSGNIRSGADNLRQQFGTFILAITAAGGRPSQEDLELVGPQGRVFTLDGWREADPERLGQVADEICKLIPQAKQSSPSAQSATWPIRPKSSPSPSPPSAFPRDCRRVDYPIDLIMAVDATNFEQPQFGKILESLGTLADESFDLSPDVVRIGLLVYSDTVAVPVALGHYEDKIELLSKIASSPRLPSSHAIVLRGLEAARQQFQLHGRQGATRVVLLVTNGKHRGNAAGIAHEMRDMFAVQIYSVAIGASDEQLASLTRVVGGPELAKERLLRLDSVEELADPGQLTFLRRALCARIGGTTTKRWSRRRTTKRDLRTEIEMDGTKGNMQISPIFDLDSSTSHRVTRDLGRPIPLCSDGFLRPFLFNFIVDISHKNESINSVFHSALGHLANFIEAKFGIESQRVRLNIFGVDSEGQKGKMENVPIEEFRKNLETIANSNKSSMNGPPKLGMAISAVSAISKEQAIPGVNQIILVISENGLSSDKVEFNGQDGQQHFVAISLASPRSDLLRNLAGGSARRVIHFANWNEKSVGDQFGRWLAYAICEAVQGRGTQQRTTQMQMKTTQMPKWKKLMAKSESSAEDEPNNVILRPISASSLSVSWTCCSNPFLNYSILISPDPSLPFPSKWSKSGANCRHSFGLILDGLPSDADYTVCVMTDKMLRRMGGDGKLGDLVDFGRQCDRIWLSKAEAEHAQQRAILPLVDGCNQNGQCQPKTTTPNSNGPSCPCEKAIEGKCPKGFRQNENNECIDIDECREGNGGCSHGCLNTPGGHYCACPPPLVLDPTNPHQCIPVKGGLARAVDLLGHLAKWAQKEETNGGKGLK